MRSKILTIIGSIVLLLIISIITVSAHNDDLPGDINGDWRVDGLDFTIWLNNYGRVLPTPTPGDEPVPTTPPRCDAEGGFCLDTEFGNCGINAVSVGQLDCARGESCCVTNEHPSPTPTPNQEPTNTPPPTSTSGPSPTPISGEFPCGNFPNASPGCMPVSYQAWYDDVPVSDLTLSPDYTPKLHHMHWECNVPQVRENGQDLDGGMDIPCHFLRYNHIVPFKSDNSGWWRSCNQGDCYEYFDMNLDACQDTKYEGNICHSEHVHTVRDSDMEEATEMRFTPNADFIGLDGGRHFISANWQTNVGYRSSSELTTRYWIEPCGTYQRVIMPNVDKFFSGSEPIPTVSGTIEIPFRTNGGCGDRMKTFVYLDAAQHAGHEGHQGGEVLFETDGHFEGNLTWDTTQTSNGVHRVLFINIEGTGEYTAAAGLELRYNVQN